MGLLQAKGTPSQRQYFPPNPARRRFLFTPNLNVKFAIEALLQQELPYLHYSPALLTQAPLTKDPATSSHEALRCDCLQLSGGTAYLSKSLMDKQERLAILNDAQQSLVFYAEDLR